MAQPKTSATKRKGNPAKRAEELKISQIGDFKKRMGGVMELPSGAVVKLKNPGGMQAFIGESSTDIPNPLMPIIQDSLKRGQAPQMNQFVNDDGSIEPEMLEAMQGMFNMVMVKTVVMPPVSYPPTAKDLEVWNAEHPDDQLDDPDDLRSDEVLYADEFPDADKQFVFRWITGGVKDLEAFRQEQRAMLGDMAAVAGDGSNTK